MISTYTDPSGKRVSHDYTAEIKAKMDYVDSHDPFGGAGTVSLVCERLGRDSVYVDLNREYAAMAERRIRGNAPLFAAVAVS